MAPYVLALTSLPPLQLAAPRVAQAALLYQGLLCAECVQALQNASVSFVVGLQGRDRS
jgi:hypothetical protein